MTTENAGSRSVLHAAKDILKRRWHLVLLGLLVAAQLAVNWAWLSTNVVLLGWDRPRHLIESLVYNDILNQLTLRSLFEAWTHSGYYPPLFHWAMVSFYRLFGVSMDAAAAVNMVFLVALLVAAYGIGRKIGGSRRVGLLSAFVASTFPMIFGMSRYTYIEFALTAMVALSMWLLLLSGGFRQKSYSLLFGLSVGLGLLTKWTFSLFVFPALVVVILRSGLLSQARASLRSLRLDLRWMGICAALAAALSLVWYIPNVDRVSQLPLGHLMLPISWFLLGGLIYVLKQPATRGWNLAGGLWLGLVVAGSWYLSRIDFVNHTFLIAWGRPERQSWAFGYYFDHLVNEQLSLFYALMLGLAVLVLVFTVWGAVRKRSSWPQMLRSDVLLLILWVVLPYLVFSFRPSSKHSRFVMPILPAMAVLVSYGLSRIKSAKIRLVTVALVLLVGTGQWLALSFDGLGWLREAALMGQVNVFAHMFQNQLPSTGDTDRGYWVVPEILEYVSDQAQAQGEPMELALLVNTRQVHDEHFLYAIYTGFPDVRLRELAQNWTGRPAYPQLFEVDYVAVPSNNPAHKIDPESLEVVETILERPPTLYQEAFRLVDEYPLPDGNLIYLYERQYPLADGYDAEQYELLARELESKLGDGDALVLHPSHQTALLGRYYQGHAALWLPGTSEDMVEMTLVEMLQETVTGHERVATVFESGQGEEIQATVGRWLSEECFPALDAWYGPALLSVYACPSGSEGRNVDGGASADFGGEISLVGHSVLPAEIVAGEALPLTLIWQATAPVARDYKVFVHLLDARGSIVAQADGQPRGGWRPTSTLQVGEPIPDAHAILTTASVIAGEYELVVGLYDSAGDRLPVVDEAGRVAGDSVSLGTVKVVATCHCATREAVTERVKYRETDD